jgi:starvation-inducible outer membrane lipoprotein
MKTALTITIAAMAALAGCATSPDRITAASIPARAYAGSSCAALASQSASESAKLANLSKAQSSAAMGDTIGVLLLGVPVSSMAGGDKEAEIAVAKGKVNALHGAAKSAGC